MQLPRALVLLLLVVGCDAPTPSNDAARPDAAEPDAAVDAGADAGGTDAGPADAGPALDVGRDAGSDTDGDGIDDATEIACATDPALASSVPDPATLRGAGTDADPYRICLAEHLTLFAALAGVESAHARVGRDLDLTGFVVPHIGVTTPYAAAFDGAGHTLSHLTLGAAGAAGTPLFTTLGATGVIRNLTIESAVSFGGSPLVGQSVGLIDGVVVDAVVTDGSHIGIVVNENAGIVRDCASSGTVTGGNHVGGITGASNGMVLRCASTASVSGMNRVGGLVGSLMSGSIDQCWASGSVAGTGLHQGGLVGSVFAGTLTDSYALGDVAGGTMGAGGLVGGTSGTPVVARVYSRGHVTGTTSHAVIGDAMGTVALTACFFDGASGATDAACTSLTPTQMTQQASFPGFDFATPIWVIDAALRSSPVLHWE